MRRFLIITKPKFCLLVFLKMLSAAALTGTAFVLQNLIDFALNAENLEGFGAQVGFSLAYVAFAAIVTTVRGYYEDVYLHTCEYRLKEAYFNQLLQGKFSEVSRYDSSKYISAMTNDVNILSVKFFQPFSFLLDNSFTVVFAFFSVMALNWMIGLEMLALTSLLAVVPAMLKKAMDRSNKAYSEALQKYTEKLKEFLLGLSVVHVFSMKKRAAQVVGDENRNVLKRNNYISYLNNTSGGVAVLLSLLLNIGLVATGVYYALKGRMEIGAIVAISSLASRFYQPIQNVAGLIMQIFSTKSIGKELLEIIDYQSDEKNKDTLKQFSEEIRLEDVSFSYPNGDRKILNHVSLRIEHGKKYLIVGKSGSGKSTILKLLAKINDSYEGALTIDGHEYRALTDSCIGEHITFAQQNSYLFNMSLRRNIDIHEDGDEEKLLAVMEQTRLTSFAASLPEGLDTIINEEINQVSGGEKLRIGLARALYKGGDVLLLDEVTSALDKETSEIIEEHLLQIQNKTIVNVCHKYNETSLAYYDQIIVVENGAIAATGTYDEIKNMEAFQAYRYAGAAAE